MPPREFTQLIQIFSFAAPFISMTTTVPLVVWLGMMLLSSDTLRGLSDKQHDQVQQTRRGFAKLILRALLLFVTTMPLAAGLTLLGLYLHANPVPLYIISGIFFTAWWLYVVIGSLVYAWRALEMLHER